MWKEITTTKEDGTDVLLCLEDCQIVARNVIREGLHYPVAAYTTPSWVRKNDPQCSTHGREAKAHLAHMENEDVVIYDGSAMWTKNEFFYAPLIPREQLNGWNEWDGNHAFPPCGHYTDAVLVRFRNGEQILSKVSDFAWHYDSSHDNIDHSESYDEYDNRGYGYYEKGEHPCDIVAYEPCWISQWFRGSDKFELFPSEKTSIMYHYFVGESLYMHSSTWRPEDMSEMRMWCVSIPYSMMERYFTQHREYILSELFKDGTLYVTSNEIEAVLASLHIDISSADWCSNMCWFELGEERFYHLPEKRNEIVATQIDKVSQGLRGKTITFAELEEIAIKHDIKASKLLSLIFHMMERVELDGNTMKIIMKQHQEII